MRNRRLWQSEEKMIKKKYRQIFQKIYDESNVKFSTFPHHVDIVVYWAEKLCDANPKADREAVIIAALLHDIGHFVGEDLDHAISSEKETRKVLEKEGYEDAFIDKVAHAIRAHRNKDIKPDTIEAKIVCFADSASHLTADVYPVVLADRSKEETLAKIERDYRDLATFPDFQQELQPLYESWKKVIETFPEEFIQFLQK